jgi:hypothetical protein
MRQNLPESPRVHFARDVTPSLLVRPNRDLLTSKKRYVRPERRRRVGTDAALADGQFAVQFEEVSLQFRRIDKIQTVEPAEIVENKRLGAALAMVKQHQDGYEPHRRRYHPARQRPPNNLEAPGQPTKGRPSRQIVAAVARERGAAAAEP